MHLFEAERGTAFQHHGDFSGECIVIVNDLQVRIPCQDLLEFAAHYVRTKRERELEGQAWHELLE